MLHTAASISSRFPATLALMGERQITGRYAQRLNEATLHLPLEAARKVETRVLPKASRRTLAQFAASVRRRCWRRIRARLRSSIARRWPSGGWSSPRATTAPAELWACGYRPTRRPRCRPASRLLAESWKGLDQRTADQRRADALLHASAPAVRTRRVEAGRQRHRRPVHVAGSGRAARGTGRARTHPGRAGPRHRHRPERHLAATGHRRARQPGRRLLRHLPATRGHGPLRRSPRRDLLPPGLPAGRGQLRPRPHGRLGARRDHLPGQPHAAMQPAPPPQARRRLAVAAASRTTPSAGPPPPATPTTDHHRTHCPSTPRRKSPTPRRSTTDLPPPF